ncbi:unnamed protein product [Closterium sp. NIES-54]
MAQALTMSTSRATSVTRADFIPATRRDATSAVSPRVALSQAHLSSRLLSRSRIPGSAILRSQTSRRHSHASQFNHSLSHVVAAVSASVAVEEADVVIVGAGVSGLCTGLALTTDHADTVSKVIVTEARERVGGNITTVVGEAGTANEGYLWEEGPNSFQPNDAMLKCALDSGVIDQLVLGDPDAPRFVFWEGRLRPVPAGLLDLPVFDLMSIIGKIRAGLGAFGLRPAAPEGKEESVEEFVRRNLGAEVFERLIEPFCSGVYAGDPSKLSMKAAFGKVWRLEQLGGSIFGGSMKLIKEKQANPPPPRDPRLPKPKGQTVGSFQKGLITLPTGIANKLGDRVRLGWKLTAIEKRPGGSSFLLSYDTPEGAKKLSARSLLLTVPSYVAADLLKPYSAPAAAALSSFYYPPVVAVTISYPKEAIREDRLVGGELKGFGQLHPRTQGIVTLGTIYSSVLFPNRAPDGRVLLLCYIGGACNTKIATMSEEIVKQVDIDVRKMLIKPDAAAPQTHGVRVWPYAIPQFNMFPSPPLPPSPSPPPPLLSPPLPSLPCLLFSPYPSLPHALPTCQSEEEIVKQVDIDVRKMLIKPDAAAPQTHGVRVRPHAIPQFNMFPSPPLPPSPSPPPPLLSPPLPSLPCLLFSPYPSLPHALSTCQSEEEIVKQVDIDVRKMLIKPDAAAPQTHGVRVWPRAIPQFNVGHLDNLAKAREEIRAAGLEGVFLGGNYVAGVALGRCVEGGYESAAEVVQYLKENVAVSK